LGYSLDGFMGFFSLSATIEKTLIVHPIFMEEKMLENDHMSLKLQLIIIIKKKKKNKEEEESHPSI
jgi:hypothetical protein